MTVERRHDPGNGLFFIAGGRHVVLVCGQSLLRLELASFFVLPPTYVQLIFCN